MGNCVFSGLTTICLSGSVITLSEIAKLKKSQSNSLIKRQIVGCVVILNSIAFWCLGSVVMRSNALTMEDGGARRQVFMVGLILVVAFTLANIIYFGIASKYSSRKIKK